MRLTRSFEARILKYFWEHPEMKHPMSYRTVDYEKLAKNKKNVILVENDGSGLLVFEPSFDEKIIYKIHAQYHPKSRGIYFKQSLNEAIEYMKNMLNIKYLHAEIPEANKPAIRMVVACGFVRKDGFINSDGEEIAVLFRGI